MNKTYATIDNDRIINDVDFANLGDSEVVEEKFGDNADYAANENRVLPNSQNKHILGKFDTVEALSKAYQSLQAEFTRKSQQLAELKRNASLATEFKTSDDELSEFIASIDGSSELETKIIEYMQSGDNIGLTKAVYSVLSDQIRANERDLQSPDYLKALIYSHDEIKDEIINEYIKNCAEGQVPHMITSTYGSNLAVSTPQAPQNFQEIADIMHNWLTK